MRADRDRYAAALMALHVQHTDMMVARSALSDKVSCGVFVLLHCLRESEWECAAHWSLSLIQMHDSSPFFLWIIQILLFFARKTHTLTSSTHLIPIIATYSL